MVVLCLNGEFLLPKCLYSTWVTYCRNESRVSTPQFSEHSCGSRSAPANDENTYGNGYASAEKVEICMAVLILDMPCFTKNRLSSLVIHILCSKRQLDIGPYSKENQNIITLQLFVEGYKLVEATL